MPRGACLRHRTTLVENLFARLWTNLWKDSRRVRNEWSAENLLGNLRVRTQLSGRKLACESPWNDFRALVENCRCSAGNELRETLGWPRKTLWEKSWLARTLRVVVLACDVMQILNSNSRARVKGSCRSRNAQYTVVWCRVQGASVGEFVVVFPA